MSEEDKRILLEILNKHPYEFYAYGSRVKGYAKKFSDLDICYFEKIPSHEVVEIRGELEDSNITIKVDLTPVSNFSKDFFSVIRKDLVRIK